MPAPAITITYRPIRLGWCVCHGSRADVRRALRLTHTLWGGRFNPIIAVGGQNSAEQLVSSFRVDALYAVGDDPSIKAFISKFPWLPWPDFEKELFVPSADGRVAAFLDVYHVVRRIFEEQIKDKEHPTFSATQLECAEDDPISDVVLASFGGYPARDEIGKDYADFVANNLRGQQVKIAPGAPIDAQLLRAATPSALTTYDLDWDSGRSNTYHGVYVGDAGDFDDIVNFWNLRASDSELTFFDPTHADRFRALRDVHLGRLGARTTNSPTFADAATIWHKQGATLELKDFGATPMVQREVSNTAWTRNYVVPRQFHIGRSKSVLGTLADSGDTKALSVQLPEKPFFDGVEFRQQQVVIVVSSVGLYSRDDEWTFRVPFLPKLNEFYGKRMYFHAWQVRAESPGIAIITSLADDQLNLEAIPKRDLVSEIFRSVGIKAELSAPGRIASRLIQQMGGIQGCRVFKIPGVRELLEQYGPLESFDRSAAIQKIGKNDPQTGQPNFSDYEGLFIEQRETHRLTPEQAFLFLLKKEVFQVGLSFICPHCELDPWIPLDNLSSTVRCEYCGRSFLCAPQLRDRNWKYRRSGLFGRQNNQEGSIPVVVTLQQLDTAAAFDNMFVTNMILDPGATNIEKCETDFVFLEQFRWRERLAIAIGECKTRKEISPDDVRKLTAVANLLDEHGMDSFIIFSKLIPFTDEEIVRCQLAQSPTRMRVIMLTHRELEPYFIYERTEREFDIHRSSSSLEDLAETTDRIYFHPKPKAKAKQ